MELRTPPTKKEKKMCQVVEYAYRQCKHHHHWELAIPCQVGFNSKRKRCKGRNHEVVRIRRMRPGGPVCCRYCLEEKQRWIKQAFIVKLIRLKAATMTRPCGDAELAWRFRTWLKQASKEYIRTLLTHGYRPDDDGDYEFAGNMSEDEFDRGWFFAVSQADLHVQMRDVQERIDRGDECPEYDFWYDRGETDKEQAASIANDGTVIEGKHAANKHQEMTDPGGGEEEDRELTDQGEGEVDEGEEKDDELTDQDEGEDEDEELNDEGKIEEDDDVLTNQGENEGVDERLTGQGEREEEHQEMIDIHASIAETRALLDRCTNNLERLEELFISQPVNRNTSGTPTNSFTSFEPDRNSS